LKLGLRRDFKAAGSLLFNFFIDRNQIPPTFEKVWVSSGFHTFLLMSQGLPD
jgi:hypothetical protein